MPRSHTMNPGSRNTRQSGVPQGTPGGQIPKGGRIKSGKGMTLPGEVTYLWILVALEIAAMAWLRHSFRRYHGG